MINYRVDPGRDAAKGRLARPRRWVNPAGARLASLHACVSARENYPPAYSITMCPARLSPPATRPSAFAVPLLYGHGPRVFSARCSCRRGTDTAACPARRASCRHPHCGSWRRNAAASASVRGRPDPSAPMPASGRMGRRRGILILRRPRYVCAGALSPSSPLLERIHMGPHIYMAWDAVGERSSSPEDG